MAVYRVISSLVVTLFIITSSFSQAKEPKSLDWPVLRHYDQNHIQKIALPLGGIGTGTVSLGGRGNLQDWEIMNRPAKGYNPGNDRGLAAPFFALYVESGSTKAVRLLEGPVPLSEYEGAFGVEKIPNHGLPRFQSASFDAAYPLGQVNLSDPSLSVNVRIKAFNPLVPGDADRSGIPIAILKFEIKNISPTNVAASVCGSMQNFIGEDGSEGKALKNKNEFRKENGLSGIFLSSDGVDKNSEQWGTITLSSNSPGEYSYRTCWIRHQWGAAILDFWDDFSQDGVLEERPATEENKPMASLAVKINLSPGETRTINFFLTWHFPNRKAWSKAMLKNYYTAQYADAWEAVKRTLPELDSLEKDTVEFVSALCKSSLPEVVKEAALFNISTLRTQTCFRTDDGYFFAWEGCGDKSGCCYGSCTHVWNYEQATAFLFGELAMKMREVEFGLATDETGLMSFRVGLPKENIRSFAKAAADGQMGTIMKMYHEWQLSGDDEFIKRFYPNVKKALQFCWIPGGWDADIDGVMEGAQHNTMDVEYFGPNPQMEIWYLGALRAMEEMAKYLGDRDFAKKCRSLFAQGSKWTDANLFNGEYYIHKVIPPKSKDDIAPGLIIGAGAENPLEPDYQLGEGCLVDQLVGQFVAHVCGLGYLVEPQHVKTTLESIMKYNYMDNLQQHFNCLRSFALGDEAALLMASYPGQRPKNPFPYFSEVMTGFEYAAAIGMLYENQIENGLKCIQNIRDRYDGYKRSPFDEAECGHHYGRAMASWAAILALSQFNYSAVKQNMTVTSRDGTYFWSNGRSYGTIQVVEGKEDSKQIQLKLIKGSLSLETFSVKGFGTAKIKKKELNAGESIEFIVKK